MNNENYTKIKLNQETTKTLQMRISRFTETTEIGTLVPNMKQRKVLKEENIIQYDTFFLI